MKFTSKQTTAINQNVYSWENILNSIREIIQTKKTDKEKINLIEEQLRKISIENGVKPEADRGNHAAQLQLGYYYLEKHDDAEAVKWFCSAKKQTEANVMCWIGELCYKGEDVKQDYAEAAKWFRKSAEIHNAEAQRRLGKCFLEGIGVQQSDSEAAKWLCKAAGKSELLRKYSDHVPEEDLLVYIGERPSRTGNEIANTLLNLEKADLLEEFQEEVDAYHRAR